MQSTVKILLSYHKPDYLFKDEVLTPVHAGRAGSLKRFAPEDKALSWLLENTLGDNTGDNISGKNSLYNEMTTVYWAWKNYQELGNPSYIGFMHYRRHFIFDDSLPKASYECEDIGGNYFSQIRYSRENVLSLAQTCDFIAVRPLYRQSVYAHYKENHEISILDTTIKILKEKYPSYAQAAEDYLAGSDAYFWNMFIFPKDTFFRYAEWIFDIMFELEKKADLTGQRMFVSERLTGIFFLKLMEEGKKGRFLPTIIAEGEHEIPVILSADNNYAQPLIVSIASLLLTAHRTTTYSFYLLVPDNFSRENKEKIQKVCEKHGKYKLHFVDMKDSYRNTYLHIKHISKATYYRLKIPSMLSDINKCIYLDVDLVAKKDLSDLYRINVDDKYIAGVKAAGYYETAAKIEAKREQLGIAELDSYVNAGVLVMNLAKMREDNLEEIFAEMLGNKWPSQDQDILNAACYGKIRVIQFKYNAMTKYALESDKAYKNTKSLRHTYGKNEWETGRKNPSIIHYADKKKPWEHLETIYAKEWWNVVRYLPVDIANDIYESYMEDLIRNCHKLNEDYKLCRAHKTDAIKKVKALTQKINKIKTSKAYRIGNFILYLPRKIRKLFRK